MFALRHSTRASALATAFAVALVASIAFPVAARAAEPTHDKMMKMPSSGAEFMKMDPAECMMMMDHNHDSKVTKKEYMKFQEELFKKMAKKDPNSFTREEWLGQVHTSP